MKYDFYTRENELDLMSKGQQTREVFFLKISNMLSLRVSTMAFMFFENDFCQNVENAQFERWC